MWYVCHEKLLQGPHAKLVMDKCGVSPAEFDAAIIGNGLMPSLFCLSILDHRPDLHLLMVTQDDQCAGCDLELVPLDRISASLRAILDPYIVQEWPGFHVTAHGRPAFYKEPLALLDPVQISLDLAERIGSCTLLAGIEDVRTHERRLLADGTSYSVDGIIDLRPIFTSFQTSVIIKAADLERLDAPVLADFDVMKGRSGYCQFAPLGDGRTLIIVVRPPDRSGKSSGPAHQDLLQDACALQDLLRACRVLDRLIGDLSEGSHHQALH